MCAVFTRGLTEIEGFSGRELAMSLNKTRHWFMSVSPLQVQQVSTITRTNTRTHKITVQLNHRIHSCTVHLSNSTLLLQAEHSFSVFFFVFFYFFSQSFHSYVPLQLQNSRVSACIITMKGSSKLREIISLMKTNQSSFQCGDGGNWSVCVKLYFCPTTLRFKYQCGA